MNISLPMELKSQISQADAALYLAIGLYVGDKVSFGQAAIIAGITRIQFQQVLGKNRIPLHYDMADAEQDIATVEKILAAVP